MKTYEYTNILQEETEKKEKQPDTEDTEDLSTKYSTASIESIVKGFQSLPTNNHCVASWA